MSEDFSQCYFFTCRLQSLLYICVWERFLLPACGVCCCCLLLGSGEHKMCFLLVLSQAWAGPVRVGFRCRASQKFCPSSLTAELCLLSCAKENVLPISLLQDPGPGLFLAHSPGIERFSGFCLVLSVFYPFPSHGGSSSVPWMNSLPPCGFRGEESSCNFVAFPQQCWSPSPDSLGKGSPPWSPACFLSFLEQWVGVYREEPASGYEFLLCLQLPGELYSQASQLLSFHSLLQLLAEFFLF